MKITVGISFFNDEATLESAIRSVFAQRMQDWELLLVDDGSTDGSLEIARRLRDPRVRVVSDGQNLGFAARLNQITRMATGEYIARMDADDLMHPDRLAEQAQFLHDNPQVDVVGSSCYIIDDAGRVRGHGHTAPPDTRPVSVLRKPVLLHPSCMGRRSWFLRNPYDESLVRAQDMELWIRTASTSTAALIPRPLLFYRITTARSRRAYLAKSFRSLAHHLRTVARYGPPRIGRIRSYLLMARIGVFHLALTPFALLDRPASLIHRRSPSLAPAEQADAQATLERARQADAPGLPAPEAPRVQVRNSA